MFAGRQPQHRFDCLGVAEAGRHIDSGAEGQRHHRTDTGDRHQPPAHRIVAHDGQQAAMQDGGLLAQHASDDVYGRAVLNRLVVHRIDAKLAFLVTMTNIDMSRRGCEK